MLYFSGNDNLLEISSERHCHFPSGYNNYIVLVWHVGSSTKPHMKWHGCTNLRAHDFRFQIANCNSPVVTCRLMHGPTTVSKRCEYTTISQSLKGQAQKDVQVIYKLVTRTWVILHKSRQVLTAWNRKFMKIFLTTSWMNNYSKWNSGHYA